MKYSRDNLTKLLSPKMRAIIIDNFVGYAPDYLMRFTETLIDLPIPAVVRNSPSIFIHIPKNAGTTVCYALYHRYIGHRAASWYRSADRQLFDSKFKFSIMRDPVDRFISAFYFLQGGGTALVPASPKATEFIRRYESIMLLIDDIDSGYVRDFKRIDPVLHQQSDYLMDKHNCLIVDGVYKLEKIIGTKLLIPGAEIDMAIITNRVEHPPFVGDIDKLNEFVRAHYAADYELLAKLKL